MKRITAIVLAVVLTLLLSAPVLAASLSISPATVEFEVPANGSTEVTFIAYNFTGDITIDCENIPLKVEPTTVSVKAKEGGDSVVLTFYGDESRGSKIYEGKIRFVAMTGGMVAMGIKVKARVTNLVAGQTSVLATPEEPRPVTEIPATEEAQATEEATETLPEEGPSGAQVVGPVPGKTEWPILPLAGIAAGTAIVITLIVVLAGRRRY